MLDDERGCGFNLFDVFYVRERREYLCVLAQIKRENERDAYIREGIYHH